VPDLADELVDLACRGLVSAGVEEGEASAWLDVIRRRVDARVTGALWQSRDVAQRERSMSRRDALSAMFRRYRELSAEGAPVHEWPV
jgi:hypothetical protein